MTERQSCLRAAAILVDSLEPPAAEALLEQMPREAAERLRQAVGQLDQVEPRERQRILNEFLHGGPPAPRRGADQPEGIASSENGPRADQRSAAGAGPQQCESVLPLASLQHASADRLARFLATEHPQTISIVLAHVGSKQSVAVLSRLEPTVRTEVLRRLARLGAADASVVREVGDALQKQVNRPPRTGAKQPAGAAALRAILQAASPNDRHQWLTHLESSDRELAEQMGFGAETHGRRAAAGGSRQTRVDARAAAAARAATIRSGMPAADADPPLDFNDLIALDDVALAKVFRAADPGVTLLALTGASQQLVDRILRRLPVREGRRLRQQIEQLGPTRLSDLEHAQEELAELAAGMADRGEILVPRRRRFSAAA